MPDQYEYQGVPVPAELVHFARDNGDPIADIGGRWCRLTVVSSGGQESGRVASLAPVKDLPPPESLGIPSDPPGRLPEPVAEERPKPQGFTAVELMAMEFPEPKWAVPGIISEGLNLFVGAPKLGKSWGVLNLAIAVAEGGFAFGQVPVDKGEVLYLALEDTPRRLRTRLQTMLGQTPTPEGLHFYPQWPLIGEGGEEALEEWLSQHPACRVVIIDVFARIRRSSSKSNKNATAYNEDYLALTPFKALADRYEVAFVMVHHTRKASAEDFIDAVSGTQGLAGSADAILMMKRGRGAATGELHVTGRDISEAQYALKFDPSFGTWTLMGSAAEFSLGETQQKVKDLLKVHGSLAPSEIPKLSDIKVENAKKTLQRMASEGKVVAEQGRYSLPGVPAVPEGGKGPSTSTFNGDKPTNGFVPVSLDVPLRGHGGNRDTGDTGDRYGTWHR